MTKAGSCDEIVINSDLGYGKAIWGTLDNPIIEVVLANLNIKLGENGNGEIVLSVNTRIHIKGDIRRYKNTKEMKRRTRELIFYSAISKHKEPIVFYKTYPNYISKDKIKFILFPRFGVLHRRRYNATNKKA